MKEPGLSLEGAIASYSEFESRSTWVTPMVGISFVVLPFRLIFDNLLS